MAVETGEQAPSLNGLAAAAAPGGSATGADSGQSGVDRSLAARRMLGFSGACRSQDVYAVIEDSGRQFRVREGDVVDADLRDLPEGATELEFERVLLVSDEGDVKVGAPLVEGAKVIASILNAEAKGPKVQSFFWRRRKGVRRKVGQRPKYIQVKITKIVP
jgi:large subunit ribosomal protein L21